jgi:hypothetical protein
MTMLTGEDFFDLFRTFEHSAFRLEVRESYYEKVQLGEYLVGGPVDISYMDAWLALMVSSGAAGKRIERVRVVSSPFSDYTRYGLWLCKYNTRAGEDIRYVLRDRADGLPNHDYWLLDSKRLYIVHFNDSDEVLGAEPIEDCSIVVQHGYWRDAAWHKAIPYDEFVKTAGFCVEYPASA